MSQIYQYREVPLPEKWDEWPDEAKINFLADAMDREQLLSLVGEMADIPDRDIGEQSIQKSGLAQLSIALEIAGHDPPSSLGDDTCHSASDEGRKISQ